MNLAIIMDRQQLGLILSWFAPTQRTPNSGSRYLTQSDLNQILSWFAPAKGISSPSSVGSSGIIALLQTMSVAGFQYYDGKQVWEQLAVGDPVRLAREPNNSYDEYAIEVFWQNWKLGYVPRGKNRTLATRLDRGEPVAAWISDKQPVLHSWGSLEIEVGLIT